MKVAHVITRMIVGGAQENTLFSVQGLARLPDYQVTLLTGPETGSEGDLLSGVGDELDVVYVPPLIRSIHPMHDVRAVRWLLEHFRTTPPDVVHTHSSKAGVVGRFAARRARIPHVVHTLHSLVFHDYQPWPVRTTYRQIKRTMVPFTDFYVSVSDDIRERAIAAGIGRPEHHATVRSGFPTQTFAAALVPQAEARARLGLPVDRVIVGTVARLFPLKGHDELLPAAARVTRRHPDVLFAFVGGGPLEGDLRRAVHDLGLDGNVAFVGRVPPDDIPIAFSAFDVLVHTSLREGLARVIPQGVLAGVPVVCYDLDGSREVVVDGMNGFLVAPRDQGELAERLAAVVDDEALRARLGGVGADRVAVEFSVEEMVRQLDALYHRLDGTTNANRSDEARRSGRAG